MVFELKALEWEKAGDEANTFYAQTAFGVYQISKTDGGRWLACWGYSERTINDGCCEEVADNDGIDNFPNWLRAAVAVQGDLRRRTRELFKA